MSRQRSARPCVSVPADLLAAYRAVRGLPGLSELLTSAMRAQLVQAGVEPPAPPTLTRTTSATRLRWRRSTPSP